MHLDTFTYRILSFVNSHRNIQMIWWKSHNGRPIWCYPPANKHSNGKSTIWRCIFYETWWFSIAMLVCQEYLICFLSISSNPRAVQSYFGPSQWKCRTTHQRSGVTMCLGVISRRETCGQSWGFPPPKKWTNLILGWWDYDEIQRSSVPIICKQKILLMDKLFRKQQLILVELSPAIPTRGSLDGLFDR